MKHRVQVFGWFLAGLAVGAGGTQVLAAEGTATYLFDNRGYNTLTLQLAAPLPGDFSLWGFTDVHGEEEGGDRYDLARSFSEYRLSWQSPVAGLGLQAEVNDGSPGGADVYRGGVTWRQSLALPSFAAEAKSWYLLRAFPWQSKGAHGQVSLTWRWVIHERVALQGFADLNLLDGGRERWVVEPAVIVSLQDNLSLYAEYRYHGFERAAGLEGSGVAGGVMVGF